MYHTMNRPHLGQKHHLLNAYMEKIAECFKNHLKHVNALCAQNVELLCVKPGGTRNH
jgi:hypothetical protein